MKRTVKLTEKELKRMISESVKRVLKEQEEDDWDFSENEYIDRNGKPISVGSRVIWYDPERSARDLKRVWVVDDMRGDIVYISDEYSEAEVYPQELRVVG